MDWCITVKYSALRSFVMKKKGLLLIILLGVFLVFYIMRNNSKVPYSISEYNVKLIYCEYYMGGTKILPVYEADKKIIISEVSKMRQTKTSGEVATLPYKFIIELTNGHKIEFVQNTKNVIQIYSDIDKQIRKIKAPQTTEFIIRFIKENNFEM
jgi:hypothetical protein